MNCTDVRDALAANPADADDSLIAGHLSTCAACAAYARDMRELDARVRRALEVAVPSMEIPPSLYTDAPAAPGTASLSRDNVVPLRPPSGESPAASSRWARWAMAAGLAAVAIVAGLLSGGYPRESLADAVVGHMAEEPNAWTSSTPIPAAQVAATLRRAGFRADAGLAPVTYLQSCFFRGHYVPHFVVQTAGGPRTVMLLRDEHVPARTRFEENGYRGVLIPTVEGSIAVLARDSNDVSAAATDIARSIHYVR